MDLDVFSCAGIAFLSVAWGSSYFIGGVLLKTLGPLTIQMLRCVGSASILITICSCKYLWEHKYSTEKSFSKDISFAFSRHNRLQTIQDVVCVGFLYNIVGGLAVFYSQTHVSSGIESVIFSLESIFAAFFLFLAHKIDGSYFSKTLLLGVFISVSGVVLVSFPELVHAKHSESPLLRTMYLFLGLLSVIGYAGGAAIHKICYDKNPVNPLISVTGQFCTGALFIIPIYSMDYFVVEGETVESFANFVDSVQSSVWLSFLGWCLLCNVSCFYIFTWLIGRVGPKASLYALVVPCISLTLGVCFAGEWDGLDLNCKLIEIGGLSMVILGMSLIVAQELGTRHYTAIDTQGPDQFSALLNILVIDLESPALFIPGSPKLPPSSTNSVAINYGSFATQPLVQPISVY